MDGVCVCVLRATKEGRKERRSFTSGSERNARYLFAKSPRGKESGTPFSFTPLVFFLFRSRGMLLSIGRSVGVGGRNNLMLACLLFCGVALGRFAVSKEKDKGKGGLN